MKKAIQILFFCTTILPFYAYAQNKIEVEFKTGEDDLAVRDASVQGNLKITINYKNGSTPIVMENANRNQNWPKNSIRRVAIPLPVEIKLDELASITLHRSTTSNNIEDAGADNWDLQTLQVMGILKKDGKSAKYELMKRAGRTGQNLNIFMGGKNCNCLVTYNFNSQPILVSGTKGWIDKFAPPQTTSITVELGTGGDDLRGGGDDARIRLKLKTGVNKFITINNITDGQNLGNFTLKTFTKNILNANFTIDDIEAVELWHTGGGGMGADNWDVDKIKITITINGNRKILVDRVGAPIRRFTGDSRKLNLAVE